MSDPTPAEHPQTVEGRPQTAMLRAHTGHMLGVLSDGLLVCDTCEAEVDVVDRHFVGDDCTEHDVEHFASLEATR